MPELTRIRIEARSEGMPRTARSQEYHKQTLALFLVEEAAKIRDAHGDSWTDEGDPEIQNAKDGFWGRYTIRRDT